jgi:hypothetical protein
MTRTEAIARINDRLSLIDDQQLAAVADVVEAIATDDLPRQLTDREVALIEQSKEDFRAGRTLSVAEARARTDAFLAQQRASRAKV